jgi:hypothetical protein
MQRRWNQEEKNEWKDHMERVGTNIWGIDRMLGQKTIEKNSRKREQQKKKGACPGKGVF